MTLRFAVDTGGTFTDLVVEDGGPWLRFYKRPTTPADPVEGLLDVLARRGRRSVARRCRELLASGDQLVVRDDAGDKRHRHRARRRGRRSCCTARPS